MKKLMFAVIACAMGLSGCSSEDDCATNPEPAGDVTEIKLSAGIQGVATRTPVSTNDNITLRLWPPPPPETIRRMHGVPP